MDFIIFLILGMLDTFAILALMFRFYRFPFWEYYKEVILMSLVTTLISYLVRVELNGGVFDLVGQLFLYILFFRKIIKVRLKASVAVSLIYFVYGALSFGFYILYRATGIVNPDVVEEATGIDAYVMQLSTSVFSLLIAYAMYKFGWGRATIIRPPHFINDKFKVKELITLSAILVIVSIFFLAFHFISSWKSIIAVPVVIIALFLLIFISNRREVQGG